MKPAAGSRRHREGSIFPHVLFMVLLLAMAIALTVVLVRIQASAMAYVDGSSAWARAQVSAVHYLDRYISSGESEDLERAREELDVLDGDRQARLAMEAAEPDLETIHDGFRRGRIPEEQIPGMILFHSWFGDLHHFGEAMAIWQESDRYLDELLALTDTLEAQWSEGPLADDWAVERRARLMDINRTMGELNGDFRTALQDGAGWLRTALSFTGASVLLIVGGLVGLIGWRLSRALVASENKFRGIFSQAGVGLAQMDRSGRFLEANQALCRMLGYSEPELVGTRYVDISHPEDIHLGTSAGNQLLTGHVPSVTVEQRFIRGDGDTAWLRVTASPMNASTSGDQRYISVVEDMTESRRLSAELDYQATHDPLTGLINRRGFERKLAQLLGRIRREDQENALCFIDLDQFKVVNDTAGHVAGDQMLREVAELMRAALREHDTLARLGNDEFALIMEQCDLEAATRVCEKLRAQLADFRFQWDGQSFSMTASIGVVPITRQTTGISALIRSADIAGHLAKEQGGNRVHVSDEEDQQAQERRGQMQWLSRIRQALDEERFYLDAQLVTPLNVEEELRYELLVRMIDEEGRACPPGEFLPPAERFGAIHHIDRWVVETVCRVLAEHPAHLESLAACHVNVSGDSLGREEFHEHLEECMDRYRIPPEKICLEITETAAIANLPDAIRFMDRLARRGCTFALDDFGAGLSSFGYLRQLRVDYLKIDGSFVRDIAREDTDLAMVRAINELGLTLGKRTIAECVETLDVAEILKPMGVHYAQGWAYHYPMHWERLLDEDD